MAFMKKYIHVAKGIKVGICVYFVTPNNKMCIYKKKVEKILLLVKELLVYSGVATN